MREQTIDGGNSHPNPAYEVIDRFRQAISDADITPPDHIEPDGEIHRFSSNEKAGDTAGWYVLHLDRIPAGAFGCWRSDVNKKWCSKSTNSMTESEKHHHLAKMEKMSVQQEEEKERRHAEARKVIIMM